MSRAHHYELELTWIGNLGTGTSGYRAYARDTVASAVGKPDLAGSADRAFRGDPARWNPEDLLLAALSQCHLLSYLHIAADHGVVVTAYVDRPIAVMEQEGVGGHFTSATLQPTVTISRESDQTKAMALHHDAHGACFIASSVNFPIGHRATIIVE